MSELAGWQVFIDAIERMPPGRQASRFAELALQMRRHGDRAGAVTQALRARTLASRHGADDAAIIAQALRALTAGYHANISTDPDRITAWQRALAERIRPGMLVLEIGAGSGILAMLAARAGADVVSCDKDRIIAAVAEDIVAANGLAGRIKIVAKPIEALRIGRDLPRAADVLMLDLFGDRLFDFAPFDAIAAARPLLRDGAITIPMEVSLHAALADFPRWKRLVPGKLAGFDLKALAAIGSNRIAVHDDVDLSLRSAPEKLLDAELAGNLPAAEGSVVRPLVSEGGPVNGVAVWIRLTLAPGCVLEPRPGAAPRGFYARSNFYAFTTELTTKPGDKIPVRLEWRDKKLTAAQAG